MVYLADSVTVDSLHPGVERMGFMIPGGGINKPLENKELTAFITPPSQLSEAPFLFQAVPHPPAPIYCTSADHPTAHPHTTRLYHTGPPRGPLRQHPHRHSRLFPFRGNTLRTSEELTHKSAQQAGRGATQPPPPPARAMQACSTSSGDNSAPGGLP